MRREHWPILILVGAVTLGVSLLTPLAWLVLLTDGLLAVAVIAAAIGWGAWPVAWLGFRARSVGQRVCIATAVGLGLLSTFTLTLGASGLLNRPVAWTLVAIGGVLGLVRLYLAQAAPRPGAKEDSPTGASKPGAPSFAQQGLGNLIVPSAAALLLAVPLAIALFGASLPPGMIWAGEANGYDVLEYHLQVPREYYEAGRISFLPHNVYASFPQQMEMLYLLLMHMAGGVYAAAISAQLLHAGCGILAVVALGCWTQPGWGRWMVALLAGSTPWLAYMGCLAYVENGMLFFAAVAGGLVLDSLSETRSADWRWVLTAGLCAGLAGGCKYTALVLVATALAAAWFVAMRAAFRQRLTWVAIFVVGTTIAVSPWLIRNAAFTGNPVYPFAYDWFGGEAWSAAQAEQWAVGHQVKPEDDSAGGRVALAARELIGSFHGDGSRFVPSLFGPVLFVLAAVGLIFGWSRSAALLTVWTGLSLIGWVGLTFIPGRFAVPVIVPLVFLAGGALELRRDTADARAPGWRWPVLLVALAGALLNDLSLVALLRQHDENWTARAGVPLRALVGQTDVFVQGNLLNEQLPVGGYTWLVGDAAVFYIDRPLHYTVPFSRDPWLEYAGSGAAPRECLDWLRERAVTHAVFSWSEIERLRRTYGFPEIVTSAWVAQLEKAGMRRFPIAPTPKDGVYIEIYTIPPPNPD